MTKRINFTVSIPTDDTGFLGLRCPEQDCREFSKVHIDSIKAKMFCPYCGAEAQRENFRTAAQTRLIEAQAREKAKEYMHGEIDKMFSKLARGSRPGDSFGITYKPSRYKARPVRARYREPSVDSELLCHQCQTRFQVDGIIGYCPGCREENLQIYDADISIIRKRLRDSDGAARELRHAYGDLVTAFESFCRKRASEEDLDTVNFQDLFKARGAFKRSASIDILEPLSSEELLCLRRVFQKRHLYQHGTDTINEKYVRRIPEDKSLLGQKASLSVEEFEGGVIALRKVIGRIVESA